MPSVIILPSSAFHDLNGFYTTIYSLMILDSSWYPAHNLDALHDVLYNGFGKEKVTLVWEGADKSKQDLGLLATQDFYQQKIKQGKPFNVAWAQQKLDELYAGKGQTLFDIIVEILASHKHIDLQLR